MYNLELLLLLLPLLLPLLLMQFAALPATHGAILVSLCKQCCSIKLALNSAAAAAALLPFVSTQRFLLLMEPYQLACANNAAASNWLGARLQLLAAVLLSAVAGLAAAVAASAAASNLVHAAASSSCSTSLRDAYLFESSSIVDYATLGSSTGSAGSTGYTSSTGSTFDAGSTGCTSDSFFSSSWAGSTFKINLLGLALAYCLPIVQLLNGLLSSSAETEQEMVAVERVVAYLEDIVPEERQQQQQQQQLVLVRSGESAAAAGRGGRGGSRKAREAGSSSSLQELLLQEPQQQQQQQGPAVTAAAAAAGAPAGAAIAFVGVVMCYRPELPPALRAVSFSMKPGQKLGICGRTGRLVAVYRLSMNTKLTQGCSTVYNVITPHSCACDLTHVAGCAMLVRCPERCEFQREAWSEVGGMRQNR
jgi:ABC-type multidrug transport system fused ATPase/permease subunit